MFSLRKGDYDIEQYIRYNIPHKATILATASSTLIS